METRPINTMISQMRDQICELERKIHIISSSIVTEEKEQATETDKIASLNTHIRSLHDRKSALQLKLGKILEDGRKRGWDERNPGWWLHGSTGVLHDTVHTGMDIVIDSAYEERDAHEKRRNTIDKKLKLKRKEEALLKKELRETNIVLANLTNPIIRSINKETLRKLIKMHPIPMRHKWGIGTKFSLRRALLAALENLAMSPDGHENLPDVIRKLNQSAKLEVSPAKDYLPLLNAVQKELGYDLLQCDLNSFHEECVRIAQARSGPAPTYQTITIEPELSTTSLIAASLSTEGASFPTPTEQDRNRENKNETTTTTTTAPTTCILFPAGVVMMTPSAPLEEAKFLDNVDDGVSHSESKSIATESTPGTPLFSSRPPAYAPWSVKDSLPITSASVVSNASVICATKENKTTHSDGTRRMVTLSS